ncbi:MAG TPA: hypothetical protein VF549_09525 [Solirubrobacteraceae bacterium]|jgi:hypothetical protein
MATLTLDIAQRSLLDPVEEAARASATLADGPTLDDVVARTWSALRVLRSASCLLCGGEVAPRYGSGPHPVGGACRSCGTEIA